MLKKTGTKNKVASGGENQAADDRAAQRRILFAAFAQAQRHRDHADHHRQSRHQHRTETREAGCQGSFKRILALEQCSLAKLTTRMLFAVATPMHMIDPSTLER